MTKALKKAFANRQVKQMQKRRLAHNRLQIKLILQGLEQRGY